MGNGFRRLYRKTRLDFFLFVSIISLSPLQNLDQDYTTLYPTATGKLGYERMLDMVRRYCCYLDYLLPE
jgi:hypothetical protein